jgi:tricorn protease
VRFNGGGHVSQLLLEKLARRRIAASKSRWFGVSPYPLESPAGPMVALTNEYAGSDGDIFSHAFKLLKLGPLIGKRTWGGVIGISPRHTLIDGSVTTQPEYSYWFSDVGWQVENYGTDPDMEIEFLPSDYVAGRDPQLEEGLAVCLARIKKEPPTAPKFRDYPDLSLP